MLAGDAAGEREGDLEVLRLLEMESKLIGAWSVTAAKVAAVAEISSTATANVCRRWHRVPSGVTKTTRSDGFILYKDFRSLVQY